MEKIDFFKDEMPVNADCFGICDDEDEHVKTPAYVDTDESRRENWTATVFNRSGKTIAFIAVDNKIEMKRDTGEMENRCDAMLHNEDYVVFVELKNQGSNWIRHAVEEQLATTIQIFKENHDINVFKHKLAYVCNKRRAAFAVSHKEYMQRFRNQYGVRLVIGGEIVLK